jgi:MFS family permease
LENNVKKHYFSSYSGLPREVYFLFAARLVNSMGFFVTPLLTLILTQKLGMSKAEAGTTVALLLLTQAPCVILGGRLADTIGRKKTLLAGSLAGAAFYLACGAGLTGRTMVYCIILAADCVAVSMPASDALLADLTKPEERQSAYSLLYLGINIGMAASPIIGGLLFKDHLPLLFILDAVTTFAAVGIIAFRVPEVFVPGRRTDSAPAISLHAALKRAPVLAAFVGFMFLYDFCYSQWNFMLPAQFGDRFSGDGARLYSVLSSINAVTVIVMTPLVTRLTRRTRPLRAMAVAGIFYCAAYIGFSACGPYPLYCVLAAVFTLGEIFSAIQSGAFISIRSPAGCLGRINAFSTLVRGSSAALGPLIMGQALTRITYGTGWLIIAGIALAAAGGLRLLDKHDNINIYGGSDEL